MARDLRRLVAFPALDRCRFLCSFKVVNRTHTADHCRYQDADQGYLAFASEMSPRRPRSWPQCRECRMPQHQGPAKSFRTKPKMDDVRNAAMAFLALSADLSTSAPLIRSIMKRDAGSCAVC